MQTHGYKDLAGIYDLLNQNKDYAGEAAFLETLFRKYRVRTVLDVGCGTGTHMQLLEKAGFSCTGMDMNLEMLNVARRKVKGPLIQADMTDFNLVKYNAIICMFAAFNHLLSPKLAMNALKRFDAHLHNGGIILIDLHNPSGNGEKTDCVDGITRTMKWQYNPATRIEESEVVFDINGTKIQDSHKMRIYSIDEMLQMVREAGFIESAVYKGYGFETALPTSKNLEVFARKNIS